MYGYSTVPDATTNGHRAILKRNQRSVLVVIAHIGRNLVGRRRIPKKEGIASD